MKCPRCGTTNGRTNKFCRECGMKLEELNPQPSQDNTATLGDVALGEELYDVWKLYEAGEYDIAMTNGESLLESHPDSASAHSLMALIYERKADVLAEDGDPQAARGFLKQALEHYESIIDLNPDSAGDREKIASLRIKLSGVAAASTPKKPNPAPTGFKAALKTIPTPVLAAMGTFLVVLALLIIFWDSGGSDEPVRAKRKTDRPPKLGVTSSLNAPGAAAAASPDSSSVSAPQLQVYRFPEPKSSGSKRQVPAPPKPNPIPSDSSRKIPDIEPEKLPGLTLPLETKPKKPAATVEEVKPAKVELPKEETVKQPEPEPAPKPTGGTAEANNSSDKQAPKAGGSSLLAQAIQSSQQGSYSEAIGLARQAINVYQADIDAGRNVDAANRGIKNAKNLIRVWQLTGSN